VKNTAQRPNDEKVTFRGNYRKSDIGTNDKMDTWGQSV